MHQHILVEIKTPCILATDLFILFHIQKVIHLHCFNSMNLKTVMYFPH